MKDSKKISKILKLIKIIWEARPDERFHQLINNLQHEYIKDTGETGWLVKNQIVKVYNHAAYLEEVTYIDMFHLEDEKFLEWLKMKIKEL